MGISALTSWIAPCTVWINRKLQGKRGHVTTSTFVTVLTNLIALGCLSILAKHLTFNEVRSPPVIHCFNNSNGFANASYHFIQNASLWNAITLSTDSEVPKIRICSDGEAQTTLLYNLLPVVACLCGVTVLTSFLLFFISDLNGLQKCSECLLCCCGVIEFCLRSCRTCRRINS